MSVPWLYMNRKEIHKQEAIGVLVGFLGAIVMMIDPDVKRMDGQSGHFYLDFILVLSSLAALPMFALQKSLMRKRFLTYLLVMNLMTTTAFSIAAILFEEAQLNSDRAFGVFGWTQTDEPFKLIFGLGFLGTFCGSAVGYCLIMRFFSPVTCMNLLLLEPLVASLYGFFFGLDQLPASLTFIGMLAILAGLYLANKGFEKRQVHKAKALEEVNYHQQMNDLGF